MRLSSTGSFCEFCEISENTILQNTTNRLLLIIAVSKVVKGQLACETINYDTEIKGALSGLKQFLAAENSLKMMKNAFNFTLRDLFVLKIFKFLS